MLICYLSSQSQNAKSGIPVSAKVMRRHSNPTRYCKARMSANPPFLLPRSPPASLRENNKEPTSTALSGHHWPVTLATQQWQGGPDQNPIHFPSPSGWPMSWKMKDTMQVYETHNQVIAEPNSLHLAAGASGPAHATQPVSRGAQLEYLLSSLGGPLPKAPSRPAAAGPRKPSDATLLCTGHSTLGEQGLLWEPHFKRRHMQKGCLTDGGLREDKTAIFQHYTSATDRKSRVSG